MHDFKPPYLGAAYYPESFPREEIDRDLDRLLSHGLNTVRIAEFAWSTMEPEEGKFDFSLFREVVDKCKERGIAVVLCTPSATPPSWMEHRYPEIMAEYSGKKATHGSRRHSCPTSPTFRAFCKRITEEMAKEFAKDENVIGWQLDNEITTMTKDTGCNCPSCRQGFTAYLKKRYQTVEALNRAWEHYTWSMDFSSFEEVDAPDGVVGMPPAQKCAWEEYKNECFIDFLLDQEKILRKYTDKPIGTDMMPVFQFDIQGINRHLDVAQFNHYAGPYHSQFWFDLYRCSRDRFWVTETSTCWAGGNRSTGPRGKGFCKANTLASFALGGEMVSYWLFRSHKGGHEMGHGSVVDAWGRDMHTSDEVRALSKDLERLSPMLAGTRLQKSGIALTHSHSSHVMSRYAPLLSMEIYGKDYQEDLPDTVYTPLRKRHYRPDVISMHHDLSPYKLLITYRSYTLEEGDFQERILPWVEQGGTWVVGPLSDIYTKDCSKYRHAPFGHLEDWAKVTRQFYMPAPTDGNGRFWFDVKRPCTDITLEDGRVLHTKNVFFDAFVPKDGARALGRYAAGGDEYLEGYAAITETKVGRGRIILMGAALTEESFASFLGNIAKEMEILPLTEGSPNAATSLLDGAYGRVFCAIETEEKEASIRIPFAATDLLTGRRYAEGETVRMRKYECIFAKKD